LLRQAVVRRLSGLEVGQISVIDGGVRTVLGNSSDLQATVHVSNPSFYGALALRGSIGAGESYMDGHWSADDLTMLIRIFAKNRRLLESLEGGLSHIYLPVFRLLHALRRNTKWGSRRNIKQHYDLGNEFFALFLDESMMYSSAVFPSQESSLQQASENKLRMICEKLELGRGDHLLEIGTGWGGLAIFAAQNYGCRVTTTTVSKEQFEWTTGRVRELELEDRITVLMRDYRDLEGQFDKLVSVEMIEAVGQQYWDEYFSRCDSLLLPGGRMLLQAITIAEEHFDKSKRSVDFVKKYIFPGSCLPSMPAMADCVKRKTRMQFVNVEDITLHYARTLREWRRRFWSQIDSVKALGYTERFIKMWDFYLAYCEAGFLERHIGDVQVLLEKRERSR
jgi:cyclopropane-fatty-acyl-phospholipid synthase